MDKGSFSGPCYKTNRMIEEIKETGTNLLAPLSESLRTQYCWRHCGCQEDWGKAWKYSQFSWGDSMIPRVLNQNTWTQFLVLPILNCIFGQVNGFNYCLSHNQSGITHVLLISIMVV